MDLSQYLDIFIEEAKEHLQDLNQHLLNLEKEADDSDTINEIFRAAHSLKGMAGTMGFKRMQRLTHDMENLFSEIRNGNLKVKPELVDVLFQGLDALEEYVENIAETSKEGEEDNKSILTKLDEILNGRKEEEEVPNSQRKVEKDKLELADFERNAIENAKKEGFLVYYIGVTLMETCLLKAARAFLVFREMELIGDIIKSQPSVQDIEDENFDDEFSFVLITRTSKDKIIKIIQNISEVKEVNIDNLLENESIIKLLNQSPLSGGKDENNTKIENKGGKASNLLKERDKTFKGKSHKKPLTTNRSVRVDIEKLDELMNLVSELIIAKNGIVASNSNRDDLHNINEQIEYLENVTTGIHESVMKVRMVPLENVFNRFPRMIRDLSKKLNKKIELFISGEDTELDRTVIDEIGDPLMHLLRNAADHGLETPEERRQNNKSEIGSIYLDAFQEGNNVVIQVRDDGSGINTEAIKQKAVDKGIYTKDQVESLKEEEFIDLLFQPSFSTSSEVSDVSGRGVGLDVVRTKIQSLGGDVEGKSILGEGTSFTVRLPLTLAIMQALMVTVANEKYAIPLSNIKSIENINKSDLRQVQSKEVIHLRDQIIPIFYLDQLVDLKAKEEYPQELTTVIIHKGDRSIGVVVDDLLGQQEIVVKSTGKYINNDKIIGGATILGNGELALILELNSLL